MKPGSQAGGVRGARRGTPAAGSPRTLGVALAFLGLLAALARLPLIRTPVDVSPDGCEYLGIARHLAERHQWVSSLKWHFFTDSPVVHPALADRPPLFPLWAAGWTALTADPERQVWLVRVSNLLLAAAVPALIYWALRAAVAEIAAALAALVFMLYPAFLRNSAQPLTEPLFLLLLFASLGLFLRAGPYDRTRAASAPAWTWVASGALAGLAFLTRPSGLLLPLLYAAALLARDRRVHEGPAGDETGGTARSAPKDAARMMQFVPLLLVLGGFFLPLLPYGFAVAAQTGSPFTSILRYNYSIRNIDEGTFYGFERSFPPPALFVWSHAVEVARLVARQWLTMGKALGRSLEYLWPLLLFWRPWRGEPPGASTHAASTHGRRGSRSRRSSGRWSWGQGVLLGLALLNFLFHAMSWTVWGAARYMFPTYVVAIALLIDAPLRWSDAAGRPLPAKGAVALAVSLTLLACLGQDARLYREKARPYAGVHLGWAYAAAGRWLARTPPESLCAANQPWIINLLGRRPAVMAPRFQDQAQLRRYLNQYRPATLTLFVTEREPGDVATAGRLVEDLWRRPRLRSELSDVLALEMTELKASRTPRQGLLIFRVGNG